MERNILCWNSRSEDWKNGRLAGQESVGVGQHENRKDWRSGETRVEGDGRTKREGKSFLQAQASLAA